MADKFVELVTQKLNEICPEEEVKISQLDGKITSLALQKLVRKKKREYEKHGFSKHFKEFKKKVKKRIKTEGEKALNKIFENATEKGAKSMRESNRLSSRPGEDQSSSFSLPAHVDANFTPQQSAEAIVKYFAKISQESVPIEEDTSARWVDAQKILNQASCEHPDIQ